MYLVSDRTKQIITLSAANSAEVTFLRQFASKSRGFGLKYNSREGADPNDPRDKRMILFFFFDKAKVKLAAANDESEEIVRDMRDALFFSGGSGLFFLESREKGGTFFVDVCLSFCKHCKMPLIDMGRCEWRTCEACVAKCEHDYDRGSVHGGSAQVLSVGEFCNKCGRGKPNDEVEVQIRHGEAKFVAI